MKKIFTFIILFTLSILTIIYFLSKIENTKFSHKKIFEVYNKEYIDINIITDDIKENKLSRYFPFSRYLKERNSASIKIIMWDKQMLDKKYPNSLQENSRILSIALTDSLYENSKFNFSNYNPDNLIQILQWAESFRYAALIDSVNEIFYISIFDFWLNKITNNLVYFSKINYNIKYNFKYRYLEAKCTEYGFNFGTKVSSLEKLIYNIIDSNWAHLFDASWNQSSTKLKIIVLIIFFITIYGYYLILNKLINIYKNK